MLDEPALRTRIASVTRSPLPRSRAAPGTTSTATAHEASRAITESARLVRMIGTARRARCPPRRARQEREALGQHVAGLEIGHDQHVGAPGDRRDDLLDRRRLGADRVVERQRAVENAAGDLARDRPSCTAPPLRSVDGTFGLTVSIADRIATRTSGARSARARSMAFCTMSTFSSSVGAMFTAASVMISASGWPGTSITKQWLMRRAVRKPVSFAHHLGHQLVGVEAALHQRLGLACPHELDRSRRRGVAVRRVDQLVARDVELELLRHGLDLRLRSDEDGLDQPELRGVDRAGERALVARVRDRHGHRLDRLRGLDQPLIFFVAHADLSSCMGASSPRMLATRRKRSSWEGVSSPRDFMTSRATS